MAAEDTFIRRLIKLGLSKKEAQLYLQLLVYGPKTPSVGDELEQRVAMVESEYQSQKLRVPNQRAM